MALPGGTRAVFLGKEWEKKYTQQWTVMDLKIEGEGRCGEGEHGVCLVLGLSAWHRQPTPSRPGSPNVWPPLSLGDTHGEGRGRKEGLGARATRRWRPVLWQGPRGNGPNLGCVLEPPGS